MLEHRVKVRSLLTERVLRSQSLNLLHYISVRGEVYIEITSAYGRTWKMGWYNHNCLLTRAPESQYHPERPSGEYSVKACMVAASATSFELYNADGSFGGSSIPCLNWHGRVCGQGTGIDLALPSLHSAWKCNPNSPRLVARRVLNPRVIAP
jgi:hypothetical protein